MGLAALGCELLLMVAFAIAGALLIGASVVAGRAAYALFIMG